MCWRTKECANMFIQLSEQIVRFLEDLEKFLFPSRVGVLVTLQQLSFYILGIAHIWESLQKEGKALRAIIQYVFTSLSELDLNGLAGQRRWKTEDGLSLGG